MFKPLGILHCLQNIFPFKHGKIRQKLINAFSNAYLRDNHADGYPHSANNRFAAHDAGHLGNTVKRSIGKGARQKRQVQGSVPDFVRQAIKNCPEDSLVATGSSRLRDMGLAKQRAEVLARGEISRNLQALSSSMIRDYAAASEADPSAELSFTEALNTALAKQTLTGARIVDYDVIDGTTWVIVEMPKSAQKTAINQAANAAKLAPAWAASLDAEERMEAAFAKNNLGDVPVATE
jgi:ferredoxin